MRGWKLGVSAAAALFLTACVPFSCTMGMLDMPMSPWRIRTQFGFWDAKVAKMDGNKLTYPDRPDDEGGKFLKLRLYGFLFDPLRDRRTWTAEEWQHYANSLKTQPYLLLQVAHAGGLKNGDELTYNSEDWTGVPNTNDPVLMPPTFSSGHPLIHPLDSDYPGNATALGSKVKATVSFVIVPSDVGPLSVLGSVEYNVDKGNGDPDDVTTGSFTVRFSAPLIGERLAECNESVAWGISHDETACGNMDSYQGSP